jgi:hypothetical protein
MLKECPLTFFSQEFLATEDLNPEAQISAPMAEMFLESPMD